MPARLKTSVLNRFIVNAKRLHGLQCSRRCTVPAGAGHPIQHPAITMAPNKQKAQRQPKPATSQKKKGSNQRNGLGQSGSGYTLVRGGSSSITVRGKEVLGTVDASVTGPNIGAVFDSNPACWTNSRLALLAKTYEKYRYTRATIRFVPSVAATTSGVLALYVETDPDETLATGASSIQVIANMQFSHMGPVYQQQVVQYVTNREDKTLYFCSVAGSSERRDTTQFLVAANVGNLVWPTGTYAQGVGYIEIDYEIEFMYQELELAASGIQYAPDTVNILAAAASDASSVTFTNSALPTTKVLELRFREAINITGTPNSEYAFFGTTGTGNQMQILPGMPLYAAYSGGKWQLFHNYIAAKVLAPALAWVTVRSALAVSAYVRTMVERSNAF